MHLDSMPISSQRAQLLAGSNQTLLLWGVVIDLTKQIIAPGVLTIDEFVVYRCRMHDNVLYGINLEDILYKENTPL